MSLEVIRGKCSSNSHTNFTNRNLNLKTASISIDIASLSTVEWTLCRHNTSWIRIFHLFILHIFTTYISRRCLFFGFHHFYRMPVEKRILQVSGSLWVIFRNEGNYYWSTAISHTNHTMCAIQSDFSFQ